MSRRGRRDERQQRREGSGVVVPRQRRGTRLAGPRLPRPRLLRVSPERRRLCRRRRGRTNRGRHDRLRHVLRRRRRFSRRPDEHSRRLRRRRHPPRYRVVQQHRFVHRRHDAVWRRVGTGPLLDTRNASVINPSGAPGYRSATEKFDAGCGLGIGGSLGMACSINLGRNFAGLGAYAPTAGSWPDGGDVPSPSPTQLASAIRAGASKVGSFPVTACPASTGTSYGQARAPRRALATAPRRRDVRRRRA